MKIKFLFSFALLLSFSAFAGGGGSEPIEPVIRCKGRMTEGLRRGAAVSVDVIQDRENFLASQAGAIIEGITYRPHLGRALPLDQIRENPFVKETKIFIFRSDSDFVLRSQRALSLTLNSGKQGDLHGHLTFQELNSMGEVEESSAALNCEGGFKN